MACRYFTRCVSRRTFELYLSFLIDYPFLYYSLPQEEFKSAQNKLDKLYKLITHENIEIEVRRERTNISS